MADCKDCICFMECAYTNHYLPAGDCFKGRCETCVYFMRSDPEAKKGVCDIYSIGKTKDGYCDFWEGDK